MTETEEAILISAIRKLQHLVEHWEGEQVPARKHQLEVVIKFATEMLEGK